MTTTERINTVLNVLRSRLGLGETPSGSNSNEIVTWYNNNVDRIGAGAWCEMTNTWAMWNGEAKSLKRGRAYTVWACEDAVNETNGSSWHWGTAGMRAGDQVYYDWAERKGLIGVVDHTGTVEQIIGDGTFYVLEGNIGDRLQRMRRDKKFVVGYVRFDWSRLDSVKPTDTPDVRPVNKPIVPKPGNKTLVSRLQLTMHVRADGQWGPVTDIVARRLRNVALIKAGWPRKKNAGFDIRAAQYVIGTKVDGIWGPKSQAALEHWIRVFQSFMNISVDGAWGPQTDNAFLKFRNLCFQKY